MINFLRSVLKNIYSSTFSTFETVVGVLSVMFFSRFVGNDWKKNLGEVALVLGNGPSLSTDLSVLAEKNNKIDVDVWAVNNFCFSESFKLIRPRFYVLADPNYWMDNVSKEVADSRVRFTNILSKDVDWEMTLILPITAKRSKLVSDLKSTSISIGYYNNTPVRGAKFISQVICKWGLAMPAPLNVLIAALTLAIGSNYKVVYILGADHSWHEELVVTPGGDALVAQKHFYPEVVIASPVYKPGMTSFTVADLFLRWGAVFKSYEFLAEFALVKGVKVLNLSSKSFIDAFERSNLSRFDSQI